jgi:hypothetical protein
VLENVAPLVTEAYEKNHRGLDAAFDELSDAYASKDRLRTARATAAFRFHLNILLNKGDTHLYRIFKERVSLPEQGQAVGIMASTVLQERFPELVAWTFPLIGQDDCENMTRIWQIVMPHPLSPQQRNSSKRPSAAIGANSRSASRHYRLHS